MKKPPLAPEGKVQPANRYQADIKLNARPNYTDAKVLPGVRLRHGQQLWGFASTGECSAQDLVVGYADACFNGNATSKANRFKDEGRLRR